MYNTYFWEFGLPEGGMFSVRRDVRGVREDQGCTGKCTQTYRGRSFTETQSGKARGVPGGGSRSQKNRLWRPHGEVLQKHLNPKSGCIICYIHFFGSFGCPRGGCFLYGGMYGVYVRAKGTWVHAPRRTQLVPRARNLEQETVSYQIRRRR